MSRRFLRQFIQQFVSRVSPRISPRFFFLKFSPKVTMKNAEEIPKWHLQKFPRRLVWKFLQNVVQKLLQGWLKKILAREFLKDLLGNSNDGSSKEPSWKFAEYLSNDSSKTYIITLLGNPAEISPRILIKKVLRQYNIINFSKESSRNVL